MSGVRAAPAAIDAFCLCGMVWGRGRGAGFGQEREGGEKIKKISDAGEKMEAQEKKGAELC